MSEDKKNKKPVVNEKADESSKKETDDSISFSGWVRDEKWSLITEDNNSRTLVAESEDSETGSVPTCKSCSDGDGSSS